MSIPNIVFLKDDSPVDEYLPIIKELEDGGFRVVIHSILDEIYLDQESKSDATLCDFIMSYGPLADIVREISEDLMQAWVVIDPEFCTKTEDRWTKGMILCTTSKKMKEARIYSNKPIIDLTTNSLVDSVGQFIAELY